MITVKSMIHALQTGVYDDVLSCLYALDGIQASLDRARDRAIRVVNTFLNSLSSLSIVLCSVGQAEPKSAATTPTTSTVMHCVEAWIWICWAVPLPMGEM